MKTFNFIIFILVLNIHICDAQVKFRSGMLFHHSTGLCIWGPNGSTTSVPQQMTIYNNNHGYTGVNAVTMNELWFPVSYDNEWYLWHSMFENNDPENITSYFSTNRIIMVKSCFPSSAIEGVGEPGDTVTPDHKTIFNYKWHWRHIIKVMKANPQNFFVIWTNAPLLETETTPESAMFSKQFCKWAKDTLAAGLDPVFGAFPNNVYVFDFFIKLTNSNGFLRPEYATDTNDSHPNAAATTLLAPQLVNEVFDHSIAYEQIYGIRKLDEMIPERFTLYQNYPNPFNPITKIKFDIPSTLSFPHALSGNPLVMLKVYDMLGHEVATLVSEQLQPGTYEVNWNASEYPSGIYFYQLKTDEFSISKRMILLK